MWIVVGASLQRPGGCTWCRASPPSAHAGDSAVWWQLGAECGAGQRHAGLCHSHLRARDRAWWVCLFREPRVAGRALALCHSRAGGSRRHVG
eukprot:1190671-Prymnesium_polylepis.1